MNQQNKYIFSLNNQIKKYKNYSNKNFRKRDYIISVDKIFNKINQKVKSKQSKILDYTKITEISTKNISKEKTMNNTFNTFNNQNQNSKINNTYINIHEHDITENEVSKNNDEINNNEQNISNNQNINKKEEINHDKNLNINISNINNLNKSYKYKEYYSLNDKIKELDKQKKNLFLSSRKFYLYNKEKGIINKIRQYKSKNIGEILKQNGLDFNSKKLNLYSELKRLPTEICFGKGVALMKKEEEDKEIYENKFMKNLESKNKEKEININKFNKLITKGFNHSKKNINKYDAVYENKLIINSNSLKKYKKNNIFINSNQDLYPLLTQKKILKNILPKEIDYNTQFTLNDILNEELHPLYRYQKKNLTFHSGLISHEIDYLFVKQFSLGQMADKQKDILNRKMDEKFRDVLAIFMKENEAEIQKTIAEKKNLKIIKKKYLLQKLEIILKKCCYKFKRMKIDAYTFFQITYYRKTSLTYEEGIYLFKAIKDGDINNIKNLVKKNYKLALFKDEFGQTALHILAKRNLYQIILLLISRLADIDAQDAFGRTPLMCAVENGHMETVCVLLFNYADPSITDCEGKKAVDYIKFAKNLKNQEDYKMERALEFDRIVRVFNGIMNSEKNFDKVVRNSLEYLFKKELDINYEELIKANEDLLKEEENNFYFNNNT